MGVPVGRRRRLIRGRRPRGSNFRHANLSALLFERHCWGVRGRRKCLWTFKVVFEVSNEWYLKSRHVVSSVNLMKTIVIRSSLVNVALQWLFDKRVQHKNNTSIDVVFAMRNDEEGPLRRVSLLLHGFGMIWKNRRPTNEEKSFLLFYETLPHNYLDKSMYP